MLRSLETLICGRDMFQLLKTTCVPLVGTLSTCYQVIDTHSAREMARKGRTSSRLLRERWELIGTFLQWQNSFLSLYMGVLVACYDQHCRCFSVTGWTIAKDWVYASDFDFLGDDSPSAPKIFHFVRRRHWTHVESSPKQKSPVEEAHKSLEVEGQRPSWGTQSQGADSPEVSKPTPVVPKKRPPRKVLTIIH